MANTFELAAKYLPLLDEVYKVSSITSMLDANPAGLSFIGAREVKVYKATVNGLGNYDRNTGFPEGDITGTWETLRLEQDRGRTFEVDRMDNDETLDMAFGTLSNEFLRTKVVPEIDAYRFSKYASATGATKKSGTLSDGQAIINEIDDATAAMDENEVPTEGRILFITPTKYSFLKRDTSLMSRLSTTSGSVNRNFEMLDNMRIVQVPQTRFYTAIDLRDGRTSGETDGGYVKVSGASDINFMILHPSAVLQIVKHVLPRIFSPDTNQKMDAWKFDYRVYHDAFTYANKEGAIFVHTSEGA